MKRNRPASGDRPGTAEQGARDYASARRAHPVGEDRSPAAGRRKTLSQLL